MLWCICKWHVSEKAKSLVDGLIRTILTILRTVFQFMQITSQCALPQPYLSRRAKCIHVLIISGAKARFGSELYDIIIHTMGLAFVLEYIVIKFLTSVLWRHIGSSCQRSRSFEPYFNTVSKLIFSLSSFIYKTDKTEWRSIQNQRQRYKMHINVKEGGG